MSFIVSNLAAHGYEILNMIGRGAYGEIYLVFSNKYQKEFACKVFNCKENDFEKMKKSFNKEIETVQQLSHQNIIKYYDHFVEKHCFYIILEYCSNGTLFNFVRMRQLPDASLYRCAYQILSALEYMHSKNIAHLDIKPDNILVDEHCRLIVTDFGLAKNMSDKELHNVYAGSFMYMAPEILDKKPYDPIKADIWSFGVTMYNIAVGQHPYQCRYENQIKTLIKMGYPAIPKHIPPEIQKIIEKALVINPDERATATELLALVPEIRKFKISQSTDEKSKVRLTRKRMSFLRLSKFDKKNNENNEESNEEKTIITPKCITLAKKNTLVQLPPLKVMNI